ncbi:SulP family inorganic anion transporter [Staphylococcus simulans]|uniref:SulP family inorganic anion transporter n=1 Tax=Staphylococcus simulans TaxID=1286 RepID=UPI002D796CF2|nr:SulP family inorganic anion transporter [Staphylococcus simulans]
MKKLERQMYVNQWKGDIKDNVLAGILIALSALPGAIAYSFIVGMNPSIGLLSMGIMMIVLSLTAGRTLMITGPSSGIALVAAPLVMYHGVGYLICATIVMGILQLGMGALNVGRLIERIPQAVVIGFMNALALLLMSSQIDNIFNISIATYVFAIVSFLIIWFAPRFISFIPAPLISIIVLTIIAHLIHPKLHYVKDLADIYVVLPKLQWSQFHLFTESHALMVIVGYGITMAIVGTLQSLLTAQALDVLTNEKSCLNQESAAQGLANLAAGLFGGFGGSALVGQSKFNVKVGATARYATLVTALFLLLTIYVLGPIIALIPMVVLATVLVSIALNTFDRRTIQAIKAKPLLNTATIIGTMIVTLVTNNLAFGVAAGSAIYLVIYVVSKGRESL